MLFDISEEGTVSILSVDDCAKQEESRDTAVGISNLSNNFHIRHPENLILFILILFYFISKLMLRR